MGKRDMRSRSGEKELRRYRWFIFSVIGVGYVLAYFHRVSTAFGIVLRT